MNRIVVGVLGLGVAGALAASGAAVAHIVTTGQASPAHAPSPAVSVTAAGMADDGGTGTESTGPTARGQLRVYLKDANGATVAQVDITPRAAGGNLVAISAWDLTPGFHAIQLHSAGKCDAGGATAFASAGGVLRPAGMRNSATAGAFPVLSVGGNGKVQAQFMAANFRLRDLSGAAGSSIVLHDVLAPGLNAAQAATRLGDDSRARIACGVVYRPRTPKGGNHPSPSPTPTAGETTPPANPAPSEPPLATPSTQQGHHW
jgi:Cu-Zn family superoxide dismutase